MIYIDPLGKVGLLEFKEGDGEGAVTTVTFEKRGAETMVVLHDLYPSKKDIDEAMSSGSTCGFNEQFEQLDALLVILVGNVGRSEA